MNALRPQDFTKPAAFNPETICGRSKAIWNNSWHFLLAANLRISDNNDGISSRRQARAPMTSVRVPFSSSSQVLNNPRLSCNKWGCSKEPLSSDAARVQNAAAVEAQTFQPA